MTIVDVVPKVNLRVDVRELKALKEALETASDTVRTSWIPKATNIVNKLDILIEEIDRVSTPPHMVALEDSRLFHSIAINVETAPCRCSIGKDHFYVEMDPDEYDLILTHNDKVFRSQPSSNTTTNTESSHLTYQQPPGSRFKYICVCPRNEDHDTSVLSEAEFIVYVGQDPVEE